MDEVGTENNSFIKMIGEIMNILFFITPKSEVACVYEDDSLRQALERMEYHQYASVPMLRRDGKYVGTLTEGDLLWGIKNQYNLNLREAESMPVTTISRRMDYLPVNGKSDMEGLVDKALNQNFVPVVDDRGYFIGIITRKDIIRYFYEKKMPGHMPLQLQG
jgi:CBS domain-containing protein